MKSLQGNAGIRVTQYYDQDHDEPQYAVVELDSNTRELLTFLKDFCNTSGMWNGYDFGIRWMDTFNELDSIKSILKDNEFYHKNNPAVKAAWEHYQTMLGLAREESNQDET